MFWYGLAPVAGAFASRHIWRVFRRRFDELRLKPILTYDMCRNTGGGEYRFTGSFESVTDDQTLWIRTEDLTVPVALKGARTWLLPMQEEGELPESFDPGGEAPERIRWNQLSALTGEARVFVGGALALLDNRWTFVSSRENPLFVIFFDGTDSSLATRAIRAGRQRNEYWNTVTPYAFVMGALCELLIALFFLSRPAFRLTVITSFIAVFTPIFPLIPPGILFTVVYRRLWWQARLFRVYRDLVRLPLRHLPTGEGSCLLPNGERYGSFQCETLPAEAENVPLLIPGIEKRKKDSWFIYGALPETPADGPIPQAPADPFAAFGAVPGKPGILVRRFTVKAYTLETIAWLLLLSGIALNVFFIRLIVVLFQSAV